MSKAKRKCVKIEKPGSKQCEVVWEKEYGHLPTEDIIENQKTALARLAAEAEELAKENRQLKEELRIARSDRESMKEAVVNCFVNRWGPGGQ